VTDADAKVLDAFLTTKSASTYRVYRRTLLGWHAACRPGGFAAASRDDARAWWEREVLPLKKATQRRFLYTVRSFYNFGQEEAGWPTNPWIAIEAPSVSDNPPLVVLTQNDLHQLLATAEPDPRAHLVLLLLIATGLRVGELAAARWKDACRSDDGAWVLSIEGGHARYVKLIPRVWDALTRYRLFLELPTELDTQDTSPLTWGRFGRPIQPETLTALVAEVAWEAGRPKDAPRITAQWLRAAHAIWAHQAGATPAQIQTALGLKTRTAVDRYVAAAPAAGMTSGDVLAKVLLDLAEDSS
jgi:site-specific recombinase XerD